MSADGIKSHNDFAFHLSFLLQDLLESDRKCPFFMVLLDIQL